ncbi:MAG: signal peptide peptidase SppA [Verrucomicrobiota bacterium]
MNEIPPLLNAPPRKRTGWVVYGVIVSFFCVLSVLANFALLALLFGGSHGSSFDGTHHKGLEEQFVTGDEDATDKIVEMQLTGVIGFDGGDGGTDEGMVGNLKDQLDQAVKDKHVKAIVLRINSPGGEVVASDEIYRALAEVRDDTNRVVKIVSYVETVGASGAFYAAMGTDYIVANEMSITASIGVIMETLNFGPYDDTNSLMHKLGVKSYTFKSGKFKDILNPTRNPTDDETKLVQNLIMEVYEKFVGIVADERDLDVDELKNTIADGRIVSGKQAVAAKLVDEVGYYEDAIAAAKDLAKIDSAKVVRYARPFSLRNLLQFLGKSEAPKIQIQFTPASLKLQPGKMYFLPAYMFQ